MSKISVDKVVSSLPSTLLPNTIYAVRTGEGFDLHFSDSQGQTPHALNQPDNLLINSSGRFYCYTDRRWVTDSDDLYGLNWFQRAESGGTGTNPIIEWEHMGIVIPAGYRIVRFCGIGRVNNNSVTGVQLRCILKKPNPITRYQTGFDNDSEVENQTLFDINFMNGNDGRPNDRHGKEVSIDVDVTDMSELSLYMKPEGNITATRYFYLTYTYELQKIN